MMKKNLLLIAFIGLCLNVFAGNIKPIAAKIESQKSRLATLPQVQLFAITVSSNQKSVQMNSAVSNATVLEFRMNDAQNILSSKPENLNLIIPLKAGGNLELEVYKNNFFTPDFTVVTSATNGQPVPYSGGVHYWGIIKGDNSSLVAISIFNDEVMGMISSPSLGNLVLGKIENDSQSRHILYNDKDLHATNVPHCDTPDDGIGYDKTLEQQGNQTQSVNCIRLYWEVNYDIYTGKGSLTAATNYVTAVFNQSAILYTNDNIPVSLSQLYVWNTASPYTGTSTSTLLSQFQTNVNSFNGDLGHLIGYAGGGGIAASINGLCNSNTDYKQCYSGISSTYQNVPTFSWTVEVVTHEQGHLMGSKHTHACAWNGNNTAIDNCGPTAGYAYEGSCSGAPTPVNGGTIMSYCHLVGSVGINFSNGFGSQPKAAILAKYNAASCLTACSGGSCNTPTGMSTGSITQNSAIFSWTAAPGATSYYIQYRIVGAGSWTTGSTSTTSYSATPLTPSANYEWQVQTICPAGSSPFASLIYFTTANVTSCVAPTSLTTDYISPTSARLNWSATACDSLLVRYYKTSVPNIVYFKTVKPGTTTNTTISGLLSSTNYTWLIRTYCNGAQSGSYSNTATFSTTASSCSIPSGMATSNVTGNKAVFSWTPVNGALYYNLRYRISGTSVWTNNASSYPSYYATGLTAGSIYEWQVQTVCQNGTSSFTTSTNFSTVVTCGLTTGLNATGINSTSAVLNWNPVVCDSFLIRYYVTTAPNVFYYKRVTPGSAVSATVTNLFPGSVYSWVIHTYCNNSQSGAYTGTSSFTTPAASPQGSVVEGIEKISNNLLQQMLVYPNPAQDIITVEFSAVENGNVLLNIYDLMGRHINSYPVPVHAGLNVTRIETSQLIEGMYFIEMENDGVLHRRRMMISR